MTSANSLAAEVREVFASVTRYPPEILDLEAHLEDDLGIDSVKLGEIFSVLREKYHLPEKIDIAQDKLKTISGISASLQQYLSSAAANNHFVTMRSPPSVVAVDSASGATDGGAIRVRVREIFADVTRYPIEILDVNANLEDDLGIDSVKLGEIFSVLREQFHLPEKLDIPVAKLKTIADIGDALQAYLSSAPAGGQPSTSSAPPQMPPAGEAISVVIGREAVSDRVRQVFANVTRYPLEILALDASLEEDLGIDSVKLGEIFAVLREEFQLPEKIDISVDKLKTIDSISEALANHLSARDSRAPVAEARLLRESVAPVLDPPRNGVTVSSPIVALPNDRRSQAPTALTPERPFLGKVAFISGSGRGLGKDIAVYLADLGATVVVNSFHSRNAGDETVEQIQAAGGNAVHLWGSMANASHLHRIFDAIEERYHRLDFFISNASNGMLAPIEDLTVEHWEKAFRTNVVGLHQGALRAAKMMRELGGGKIITLSSPAAHGYVEYFGCMGAVKAAVESLTRAMAIEFAPYNVQVNCVSPGPIDGELLRKWPDSKRLIDTWTAATPQRRLCEHREVSHFIAYLLSEPVKAFTGSVLVLDGGISSQGW